MGHFGDGFCGSNDPTNSVKALKEVVVLRIRLQYHHVHLTMLQYYTVNMHAMYSQTQYKNESMDVIYTSRVSVYQT